MGIHIQLMPPIPLIPPRHPSPIPIMLFPFANPVPIHPAFIMVPVMAPRANSKKSTPTTTNAMTSGVLVDAFMIFIAFVIVAPMVLSQ